MFPTRYVKVRDIWVTWGQISMRYGKNGWATFSWVTKAPSLNEARFGQRLQIWNVWSSKLCNFPLLYFSSELKLKTHLYYKKEASFCISLISANYEREVFYWCFKRDTSIKLSKSSASGSTLQVLYFLWPSSLFHMKKKTLVKKDWTNCCLLSNWNSKTPIIISTPIWNTSSENV